MRKKIGMILGLVLILSFYPVFANENRLGEKPSLYIGDNDFELSHWGRDLFEDDVTLIFRGKDIEETTYSMSIGDKEQTLSVISADVWEKKNETYLVGDYVVYGGNLYRCLVAHSTNNGANLSPDKVSHLWELVIDGVGSADATSAPPNEWDKKGHSYLPGDLVTYKGIVYVSKVAHTTKNGANLSPDKQPSLWSVYLGEELNEVSQKKQYYVELRDEDGKVIKIIHVESDGEFNIAEIGIDISEYLDPSMGYDIKIVGTDGTVIISSAPSVSILVIFIYVFAGYILVKKTRGRARV